MHASSVGVTTADGVADAYLIRPDGAAGRPAVLFVMDAIGFRPRIEEMAQRVAAQGHVVLAPNAVPGRRSPDMAMPDLEDADQRAAAFIDAFAAHGRTEGRSAPRGTAARTWTNSRGPAPGPSSSPATAWACAWAGASRWPTRIASPRSPASTAAASSPTRPRARTDPRAELSAELYLGHADQDGSMTARRSRSWNARSTPRASLQLRTLPGRRPRVHDGRHPRLRRGRRRTPLHRAVRATGPHAEGA